MTMNQLQQTIKILATAGKGILAADESVRTASKRLEAVGVTSTEESRRQYRQVLMTAPGAEKYLSGVILFEETLNQKVDSGLSFPEHLQKLGIVPGIKVDEGLAILAGSDQEQITRGLDSLAKRLEAYYQKGARFAKWRAVYEIAAHKPSWQAVHANAETLAYYAAMCQAANIVPMVEPEVLIEGSHTLEQCREATERVLHEVFRSLYVQRVKLEDMILKPSMVISGLQCTSPATAAEVAAETMKVLKRTVPAAVPSINFLSGGQTPKQATLHLQLMNQMGNLPWNLSFSYARALQEPCMAAWKGKAENVKAAQEIFLHRLKCNSLAALGKYSPEEDRA